MTIKKYRQPKCDWCSIRIAPQFLVYATGPHTFTFARVCPKCVNAEPGNFAGTHDTPHSAFDTALFMSGRSDEDRIRLSRTLVSYTQPRRCTHQRQKQQKQQKQQ